MFGEEVKRKATDADAVLADMGDVEVFGPQSHRLGFGQAVEADLLTDYKVLVLAVDEIYVAESFQQAMAHSGEIPLDQAAKLIGCWNGLAKNFGPAWVDVGAVHRPDTDADGGGLAQHIEASKATAAAFPDLADRAQIDAPEDRPRLRIQAAHVDGTTHRRTGPVCQAREEEALSIRFEANHPPRPKEPILSVPATQTIPTVIPVGSVPEGKIADFLTGKFVKDTPEEYVRQNIEKALVRQYKYSPKDCEPEFTIKVGSSRKRVDIVVFEPGKEHTQANTYILVETKRAEVKPTHRTEGVGQLQSYMAACLNAKYGIWTNGDDRFCYAKRSNGKGSWTFDEIIEIPGFGQTEEDAQRPKRRDLKVATADNLLFAFRRCHNYIAAHEGKQKTEAFWELLKLIFTKIEDERSATINFYATPSERENATLATAAKKRIQDLFKDKVVMKYPTIFDTKDMTIDLKPSVVAYVVTQLQAYSLLYSPVDVKGVAYEEIVGSNLRGDRGEFFTPRNACRMAVTMLNPQPDERLLDPSCGTGGFLITGMNHALDYIEQTERQQWTDPANGTELERQELHRRRTEYLSQCVFGIDLNPGLVRAAKMNMVMNNDGSGGLWQANTLENPHKWNPDLRTRIPLGSLDVIVSNPPFGTKIPIDDEDTLSQYDLAAVWELTDDGSWIVRHDSHGNRVLQKSQPPEILFIERCLQLLRPGTGRMAMVIPNGILNNPGLAYVRQWILRRAQILAVVDMHRDLFQPGNDTQTSMVLMRRLSPQEVADAEASGLDYPLFMAVAEKIGHDKRGNLIYRRTESGEDALISRVDTVTEIDQGTGAEVLRDIEVTERQVDDELPDVATAYLRWLSEQG